MSRELFLLLRMLQLHAHHLINGDAIEAVVIILFEGLRLVIIVIGSASATLAAIFAVEQSLVRIDRRQVVSAGLYGGS